MKRRYSEFAHRIDIDAFEEAIGFNPIENHDGEDRGYCILPWDRHKNGDTNGKFSIHREKRVYNCWVCGGGNLLSLTMDLYDWDEQRAIDWLYALTSGDLAPSDFESEVDAILYQEKAQKPALPYFNEHVLDRWEADHDWFAERGISERVRITHQLGYNPKALKRSSKGDHEGPAIVLPHFWAGRLVGWQLRWLEQGIKPKYTNTTDFPRKTTIFNYEAVYLAEDPIVVVESVPTALMLESQGVPAVAMFGSGVTDEQRRLLRMCQQGVILAFDNDAPGWKWLEAEDSLHDYLERFIPVAVCDPVGPYGDGRDLGDLQDPPAVRERLRAAQSY